MADNSDQGEPAQVDEDLDDQDGEDSQDDILEEAKARLELAQEAESEIRKLALEDLEFRAGKQWPDNIEQDRNRDGRPCLVINRLPSLVQQVTNDQRQNRPAIKVHPVDSSATEDTAEVIQGLIRHIEYNSNAEFAYDTGFESAANGGFGYWRILPDFVSPDSFDQEIFIKRIRNPLSVYFDPYAQEPDGSDASWGFIVEDLSHDEFKQKYPDSKLAAPGVDLSSIGNDLPGWIKSDGVRVAEYFYRVMREETLHLMSTGETVRAPDLEAHLAAAATANIQTVPVRSRQTQIPVIKWCKLNGYEILEETDWLGSYIPIVPVYGAELYVNGKRILEGVIRHAKDPQRMYNYWASAETEAIALAPRTPFIGAEGQFEGYEEAWETANRRNHSYLQYKPTTAGGQPVPPPQRQSFEPAVQAITNARMVSADDLKATTGIYDSGVGAQSNETSGIAIQKRGTQIQTSTFHFVDNLARSMKHTGRILVDLIPKIYDAARAGRIIGADGEQKVVLLNQLTKDESGKDVLYALDVGRYDVTVDTGPSFASKRQESAASMMDLSRAYPKLMDVAGDLVVKNMDWPGAQELSDRIKKTLPPGLADDPKQMQIPPQAQAQMQQMQMMIKELSAHLNEKTQIIEQKTIETNTKKMVLEHDERIELAKIQADIEINMAKLGTQSSIALLQEEVGALNHRLKVLGMNAPIGADDPILDPSFAQLSAGTYGAMAGQDEQQPTGGQSPGTPIGPNP